MEHRVLHEQVRQMKQLQDTVVDIRTVEALHNQVSARRTEIRCKTRAMAKRAYDILRSSDAVFTQSWILRRGRPYHLRQLQREKRQTTTTQTTAQATTSQANGRRHSTNNVTDLGRHKGNRFAVLSTDDDDNGDESGVPPDNTRDLNQTQETLRQRTQVNRIKLVTHTMSMESPTTQEKFRIL